VFYEQIGLSPSLFLVLFSSLLMKKVKKVGMIIINHRRLSAVFIVY